MESVCRRLADRNKTNRLYCSGSLEEFASVHLLRRQYPAVFCTVLQLSRWLQHFPVQTQPCHALLCLLGEPDKTAPTSSQRPYCPYNSLHCSWTACIRSDIDRLALSACKTYAQTAKWQSAAWDVRITYSSLHCKSQIWCCSIPFKWSCLWLNGLLNGAEHFSFPASKTERKLVQQIQNCSMRADGKPYIRMRPSICGRGVWSWS